MPNSNVGWPHSGQMAASMASTSGSHTHSSRLIGGAGPAEYARLNAAILAAKLQVPIAAEFALADAARAHERLESGHVLGKIVLLGLSLSLFYHLGNGIRHLAWDMGEGFEPRTADTTAAAALAFGAAATIAVWVIAAQLS